MKFPIAAALASVVAMVSAGPVVDGVTVEYGDTGDVVIAYDLADAPAVVTFDVLTNGASIGKANIRYAVGDVNRLVEPGDGKKIFWAASRSWPGQMINEGSMSVKVTAHPADNPPDVMVVDLVQDPTPAYYDDISQLPGGITDRRYKTDSLVFRKIPAKGVEFTMGGKLTSTGAGKPHRVVFTNDFYIAVYETTQKQLLNLAGERGTIDYADAEDADVMPADAVAYGGLATLEHTSLTHYNGWGVTSRGQGTRSLSSQMSHIRKARIMIGLELDIPTVAQWEFAARAGSGALNHNDLDASSVGDIAWHEDNSDGKPHPVGLKEPNAWGLYDVQGNVWEWCLDWAWSESHVYGELDVDPPGPASHASNHRQLRGGAFVSSPEECMVDAFKNRYCNSAPSTGHGFRFWAPAKAE